MPPGRFEGLEVRLSAHGSGLRGAGGARAGLFFLDENGRVLQADPAAAPLFHWSGSFDWTDQRTNVDVPPNAARAVLQFEKNEAAGTLRIDQVEVLASPQASFGSWTPYHEVEETEGWRPYSAAAAIEPGSALDLSAILPKPAGALGRVVVKEGRLAFDGGGRARFFGVDSLPPGAYLDPPAADALADRLAQRREPRAAGRAGRSDRSRPEPL